MRRPLLVSVSLHLMVALLGYVGWPSFQNDAPLTEEIMMIDIVKVDEVTNVPETVPEPIMDDKEEQTQTPQEPKPLKSEAMPVAAPEPEPIPEPDPIPEPEPMPKKVVKPEPAVPPRKLLVAKAKIVRKPKPPPTFKVSALKDLLADMKKTQPRAAKEETQKATFSDKISKAISSPKKKFNANRAVTISEIDAVRRQIMRCWNVPAGSKDAKDIKIEIFVEMNSDGTVRKAKILDAKRLLSDAFFRTAAESARRAVLNPRCSPLKLPLEKYERWRTITLNFNPRDMF